MCIRDSIGVWSDFVGTPPLFFSPFYPVVVPGAGFPCPATFVRYRVRFRRGLDRLLPVLKFVVGPLLPCIASVARPGPVYVICPACISFLGFGTEHGLGEWSELLVFLYDPQGWVLRRLICLFIRHRYGVHDDFLPGLGALG